MLKRHDQYALALTLALGFISTLTVAEPKQGHYDAKPHHHDSHHAHRHAKWESPPAKYASMQGDRWTDAEAIVRGKKSFQTNCELCHGADGRGTGPAAKGLAHAPANLTHHFHMKPGDGDADLFWRVSEGGIEKMG